MNDDSNVLRDQLDKATQALRREQKGRSAHTPGGSSRSDESSASSLTAARQRAAEATEGYIAIAAELEQARKEFQHMRDDCARIEREREREASAARAASEAAALSQAKTMQAQQENEAMLEELISSKVNCANFAADADDERAKVVLLKRRLQLYAEKVTALEVQLTTHKAAAKQR